MKTIREQQLIGISSQTTFVRDSSLFSSSVVLGGLCGLIRSFFVARLLGPQFFGTWKFVNLFVPYVRFASLGIEQAMLRSIPFLRGKGDSEKLQSVLSTVFTTILCCSIIYSAGVLAFSFFVKETTSAKALAAFSPVILLLAWRDYTKNLALTTGLYGLRSGLEIIDAITTLLFSVAFVYLWGVYGAIAGFGVSALMVGFISARKLWQYFAFNIDWRVLRELIGTGFPIMANGMLLTTMGIVDIIMIAAMLSREKLGIYSVGHAGVSILQTIPSSLGQMLFVKFAEMDGQNSSKERMSHVLDKTTIIVSHLLAPILSVGIAFFPIAVVVLLPQFISGIAAGKLLIAGVFFLGVSLPVTNWCVSTGRYLPVLKVRLVVVAAEFIAVYLVIQNGGGLELIALCVLLGFAIFSTAMILVCNDLLNNSVSIGINRAITSMLPFVSVLSALWMQDFGYPAGPYVLGMRLFVSCSLGLVVSLAVSIPFVYWAHRRTQVGKLIFQRAGHEKSNNWRR